LPLTGSLLLAPPALVGLRGVGRGYEVAARRRAGGEWFYSGWWLPDAPRILRRPRWARRACSFRSKTRISHWTAGRFCSGCLG